MKKMTFCCRCCQCDAFQTVADILEQTEAGDFPGDKHVKSYLPVNMSMVFNVRFIKTFVLTTFHIQVSISMSEI